MVPATSRPEPLQCLFPAAALAVSATAIMYQADLLPAERPLAARMGPKRLAEFRAGRAAAREALRRLGVVPTPLVPGPSRAPQWPAGVIGSITHCEGFCAAVVAQTGSMLGIGLDAEPRAGLPEEVLASVCTPSELEWTGGRAEPRIWQRLVFSAKEAVYKCCYPVTGIELEFLELTISIGREPGTFIAGLPERLIRSLPGAPRLDVRYLITDTHIVTSATLLIP